MQDLPVNVKFIIEGMEETGSNGLDAMIVAQRDTFFSDVDYIIISDCGWLSRRPALTYGTRGNCYFFAEVGWAGGISNLGDVTFSRSLMNSHGDFVCLVGRGPKTGPTLRGVWRHCYRAYDRSDRHIG